MCCLVSSHLIESFTANTVPKSYQCNYGTTAWTEVSGQSPSLWSPSVGSSLWVVPTNDTVLLLARGGTAMLADDVLWWSPSPTLTTWTPYSTDVRWGPRAVLLSVLNGSLLVIGQTSVFTSNSTGLSWVRSETVPPWSSNLGSFLTAAVVGPTSQAVVAIIGNRTFFSNTSGSEWEERSQLPVDGSLTGEAVVVVQGNCTLVIGGTTETGLSPLSFYSCDAGLSWVRRNNSASPGFPVTGACAVQIAGSVLLMGGRDESGLRNQVWRSQDQGLTWTPLGSIPGWTPREGVGCAALNSSTVILVGGSGYADVWTSIDLGKSWKNVQLNGTSSFWSPRAPFGSLAMADDFRTGFLYGGFPGAAAPVRALDDLWISSGDSNYTSWSLVESSVQSLAGRAGATLSMISRSVAIIIGGLSADGTAFSDVWKLEISQNASAVAISSQSPLPFSVADHCTLSVTRNETTMLIVIAGLDASTGLGLNTVAKSSDEGLTWEIVQAPFAGRFQHSCVAAPNGSWILISGGSADLSSLTSLNDVWISWDLGTTWSLTSPQAFDTGGLAGHCSVSLPDQHIVVLGGAVDASPVLAAANNFVYVSTDRGASFFRSNAGFLHAMWSPRRWHACTTLVDGME